MIPTTVTSAFLAVSDDPEQDPMILARPPSMDDILNETSVEEPARREENGHSTARTIAFCPDEISSRQTDREPSQSREPYPSVQEVTVLRPVSVDNSSGEIYNPSAGRNFVATERCDGPSEAVLLNTVQDEQQHATVVSVEKIDEPATAMVVETVDEFSDDAMIRKILLEDLIASGRSTSELQEYIQRASLENVVSMMEESGFQVQEEKTEIMGLDSAIAWAHLEHEQSVAATPQPATVPDEQATVVTITDHDIHPSDLSNADAHAELIGTDYSVRVVTDVTGVATAATVVRNTEGDATEATVLDSKPAATPALWSNESPEEAIVLETKPPAEESWSRADEEQEVMVDGVVEEEATVVDIIEDVHPADIERDEVFATLIGQDYTRDSSFSAPQQHRPPSVARRAVSDQPRAVNPVDADTSELFQHGVAALDSMEENNWMQRPLNLGDDDEVIMLPPPDPPAVATAQVVDVDSDDMSVEPHLPARSSSPGREASNACSTRSDGSNGTHDSARCAARNASLQMFSTAAVQGASSVRRSTNTMVEMLFGDNRHPHHGFDLDSATGSILARTLLPWSVFPNESSGRWVATVNTNQKALDSNNVTEASKALRAFSCTTQAHAIALARAWAPPRMLPFADSPLCFICQSRFAVFKRACHCRNCGVCVCANCIVQWPSKMLSETYNIKKESMLNICKSCDWLCSTFRLALLEGNHDQAVAVHATGNVNLVTPFSNVKGELFYPVHCAVLGGSLALLKWLVEEHCCPIRSIRMAGRRRDSADSYAPILTSHGRSLLGIAMENENLEIVRYLVVEKSVTLAEVKDLSLETTLKVLEASLHLLPTAGDGTIQLFQPAGTRDSIPAAYSPPRDTTLAASFASVTPSPPEASPSSPDEMFDGMAGYGGGRIDELSSGSEEDLCIICCANKIDCVVMPCGHQICCMQCSTNISRCPCCCVNCSFMRVYR